MTEQPRETLRKRLDGLEQMPTIPVVLAPLLKYLEQPLDQLDVQQVVDLISQDKSLAAQCLHMANSPIFGRWQAVDSVRNAVVALGLQRMRDIAVSCSILRIGPNDKSGMDPIVFWEHSLGCALVCRQFARKIGFSDPSKAYLADLLHDIGIVAHLWVLPREFSATLDFAKGRHIPLHDAETATLGCNHGETGRRVAESWHLSSDLVETISFHHDPASASTNRDLVALVALSDLLCRMSGLGYGYVEECQVSFVDEPGFALLLEECPTLQAFDWARFTFELEVYMEEVHRLVVALYTRLMNQETPNSRLIHVLVADDSAFMRTAITRMIESDPELRVAATAQTGTEALEKIISLKPDVVTLDVEMPGLNGIETLKRVMQESPRPVIMVSSLTQEGAETTLEALSLGAFDYVPKQQSYVSLDIVKIREDLIAKIKAAAESHRRKPPMAKVAKLRVAPAVLAKPQSVPRVPPSVIALGTSTGGPKALQEILPLLPADLPVGILIVQHMPKGFTGPFARRLDGLCKISVREATHDALIEPGVVQIAPAGSHMTVLRRSPSKVTIRLGDSPVGTLHTPSADVMMSSVAEVFRSLSMGIILTGMGADGLQGMRAIAHEGGLTVGQDEASCTVYGMPRSCAEAGVLQRVVPLLQVPEQILLATRYVKHA